MAIYGIFNEGAYNSGKSGKPRKLRDFLNSGKLRENSGKFEIYSGIFLKIRWYVSVTQSETHA